ncbi:hypothetical protein L3X38_010760 [Prunus dulcis]|uniref:Uncharacterized protein n=1 Tax=Prunus dulcis TaxID=3755 RepID=A0AAD4WGF8_PRUDU|nr:hypothetical protein L3X38_010760 [Prunus dulcis]
MPDRAMKPFGISEDFCWNLFWTRSQRGKRNYLEMSLKKVNELSLKVIEGFITNAASKLFEQEIREVVEMRKNDMLCCHGPSREEFSISRWMSDILSCS